MLTTSQLRVGSVFMVGKDVFIVQRMLEQKTGRGAMVTKLRVKNLLTGGTQDLGLDSGEKFEEPALDIHTMKLSYIDGDTYVFMDQESYEQFEIPKKDLGDNAGYIMPDDEFDIEITFYENRPVGIVVPIAVVREITYCEPGIKGDTSGKATKPATLDTGITVQVPLFCEIGTKIKLDTRDSSFIERAK
jgi:elongation factor P